MPCEQFSAVQIAYAESSSRKTLWPDFNRARLLEALLEYQKRERRYGGSAKTPPPTRNRCARRALISLTRTGRAFVQK